MIHVKGNGNNVAENQREENPNQLILQAIRDAEPVPGEHININFSEHVRGNDVISF